MDAGVRAGDDGTVAALERVVHVWKDELDRFFFAGGGTHWLHLAQVGVLVHRVGGIQFSIPHHVDEAGVSWIAGISLGMSEIPLFELGPQWRRLAGSFDDLRSPSTGNYRRNLTVVTAADKHLATAGGFVPCDVTQTATHRLDRMSMAHWELSSQMCRPAVRSSSARWLRAGTLQTGVSSLSVTGILKVACAVVAPS